MKLQHFSPFHFARLGTSAIRDLSKGLDGLIAGRLWVKIIGAMITGIVCGLLLGPEVGILPAPWTTTIVPWLAIPGQLFLSLIQLVIIPLIFASVVLGIVSSDSIAQLKRLGFRVGLYHIFTTVVAVNLGFLVAFFIKPGAYIKTQSLASASSSDPSHAANADFPVRSFGELLSGLIPTNPFDVLVSGEMLQVVSLAIFLGVALMSLKNSEARPLVDLLNSFQKISMIVISWAMRLAPLAVFGLTTRLLAQIGLDALLGLGVYIATVLLGLGLVLVFYLIMIRFVAKESPLRFLRAIRSIQLLAFSTSSSASVMPLTIETAEKRLEVRPAISQFIVPLGTTVNMDGTALYQGIATVFLAQAFGVDLSFGQLALVVLTATLSSIGAPGAPGVGIGVLSVILTSLGIPPSGIMLIVGVDRILDMCRTVINVTGDLTAAVVMDRLDVMGSKSQEVEFEGIS